MCRLYGTTHPVSVVTCAGGAPLPEWLPMWLSEFLFKGSQGMSWCGIEWLMVAEGLIVIPAILYFVRGVVTGTPTDGRPPESPMHGPHEYDGLFKSRRS